MLSLVGQKSGILKGTVVRGLLLSALLLASTSYAQGDLPSEDAGDYNQSYLPSEAPVNEGAGFYPTYQDTLYDDQYSRSRGGSVSTTGPDTRSITRHGLWAYDDPEANFYQRHDTLFAPIDRVVGVFAPNELITIETPDAHSGVAEFDFLAPIGVTRVFDPERAHAKLGPAYFDLLFVGARVIYSDYQGTGTFGEDDGWLGIVEFGLRTAVRITDSLFLTATGSFYYLPFEDRFGINFTDGTGGAFLRLGHEFQTGSFDWLAYNQFRAFSPFYDLFEELDKTAQDVAGRYRFGFADRNIRANQFFDEDFLFFVNQVGLRGTTPVFDDQWRLTGDGYRLDHWRTADFIDHFESYHFDGVFGYEGDDLWFAPYTRYSFSGYDDFDVMFHRVYAGAVGRLTENVTLRGEGGYLWAMGDGVIRDIDSWLWSLTLRHFISDSTSHSITVAQDYADSLIGDVAVTDYVQYRLQHRIGPRIFGELFAQYGESDVVRPAIGDTEFLATGAALTLHPGDFTRIRLRAYYQDYEDSEGKSLAAYDRWIYSATLIQQLFHRTQATMGYQFEDLNGNTTNFDEHYFSLGVRTYF